MASSARQARVAVRTSSASARRAIVRLTTPSSARQAKVALSAPTSSARQVSCRLFGSEFAGFTVALESSTWLAERRNIAPQSVLSLGYAGHDFTGYLGDLQITRPLNGKTTARFDLRTPGGLVVSLPSDFAPPGYGAYAGLIRQHNGSRSREFTLTVKLAGETWRCTPLLPTPVAFNDRLSWGGEDLTALLEQERDPDDDSVPFPDIIRAAGDLVTAHQAAQQAASYFGIRIECRYPDYVIGQLRRGQGTALAWLDALAKPMQAARRWVGETLVYEQVNPYAPVAWRFVDRLNIKTLSIEELPRPKNKFILARFDPVGGPIGEDAGQQTNSVGRRSISFQASRFVVVDTLQQLNVKLKDWVFKDASGNPQGPSGAPFYSGAVPVSLAEFTSEPRIAGYQLATAYHVVARGDSLPRTGSYRFTAEDAVSFLHLTLPTASYL